MTDEPHIRPRKRAFNVEPLPPHVKGAVHSEEHRRLVEERIDPPPYWPGEPSDNGSGSAHDPDDSLLAGLRDGAWLDARTFHPCDGRCPASFPRD